MNRRFLFLFLLMLIFALFPSSLQAITYTWDGGGGADTHWNVGTNWVGDVAPAFTSTSNQDDLVFGNTYASTTITMRNESSTDYYRSITFTADAPAYTLVEELSSGVGAIYNRSSVVPSGSPNLPSSSFITNASQNQQKLDCWVSNRLFAASTNGYIGINLNNAIMSGSVEIPNLWLTNGFSLNTPGSGNTSIVKVSGPGDLQIDGNIHLSSHGSCDISINTDTLINVAGALSTSNVGVTTTTLRKLGSGTIVLNGASPNTSPNVDFAQNVAIGAADSTLTALTDVGSIRLYNAGALGLAGSASGSYTQIRGANKSNGRLELAGNISLAEYLILNGRGGANGLNPAIVNYGGDNSVDGAMIGTATDAAFFNFGANNAGEKLTVINDFSVTISGDRGVNFVGAGDGEFTGSIKGAGTNESVSIGKYGAGTLTLSGSVNDRIGHVLVRGGTLNLGASAGFAFSPLAMGIDLDGATGITLPPIIHVDGGATMDVSALAGGLSASTILQGEGNVLGTVVASANGGMKVKPGDLAVANVLYAGALSGLQADAGALAVGGLDMSTAISGTGGNPEMVWDLAALVDDASGTPGIEYDLLSVSGALTLGGSSTLTLNLAAAGTPNPLVPFWQSNHSWKVIDVGPAGSTTGNFTVLADGGPYPTAGSFSTSVDGSGDVYLNFAAVPEPATIVMLLLAGLAFAACARRRG